MRSTHDVDLASRLAEIEESLERMIVAIASLRHDVAALEADSLGPAD